MTKQSWQALGLKGPPKFLPNKVQNISWLVAMAMTHVQVYRGWSFQMGLHAFYFNVGCTHAFGSHLWTRLAMSKHPCRSVQHDEATS